MNPPASSPSGGSDRKSWFAALTAAVGGSAEAVIALALLGVVIVVGGTAWVLSLKEEKPRRRVAPPAAVVAAPQPEPVQASTPIAWAEELEGEVAELEEQREAEAAAAAAAAEREAAERAAAASQPKPATKAPVLTRAKLDWTSCEAPRYPRDSLLNREEGAVVMSFQVDASGRVIDQSVDARSGSPQLDRAALNAISKCRFTPATRNGVAETSRTQVRFVWKLDR
jgi:periplasmic protein TonB